MTTCLKLAAILPALLLAAGLSRPVSGAEPITLQVTAELAIIREKPDIMSPVVKQLVAGAILEAQKKEGDWYEVKVDLDAGGTVLAYVHASLVRVVSGPPATAGPEAKAAKEPPTEVVTEKPPVPATEPAPQPSAAAAPQQPAPSAKPPASQPPKGQAAERPSLSLWFGGRYAVVGDLNDGAQGMADFFASQLDARPLNDVDSVHLGSAFGVEYRYPLSKGLDLALGAGYFSAENSTTLNFEGLETTTRYMTTPSVRAIPVNLSLVFFPERPLFFRAGIELAFAHCEYLYRFEEGGEVREWLGQADDIGIGFVLGGGLQLKISGPVSVFAEADYRKLQLNGLDGEGIYSESDKPDTTTVGSLYYSRSTVPGGDTVTGVFIQTDFPGGEGVVEARRAELSLSGLSLIVGLRFNF